MLLTYSHTQSTIPTGTIVLLWNPAIEWHECNLIISHKICKPWSLATLFAFFYSILKMPQPSIPVVMPHNANQNNSSSTNSDGNAASRANADKIAQLEKELTALKNENKHMADNMRHISNMLATKKGKSTYDALFNVSMSTLFMMSTRPLMHVTIENSEC